MLMHFFQQNTLHGIVLVTHMLFETSAENGWSLAFAAAFFDRLISSETRFLLYKWLVDKQQP
jgi:hypothetical protein